ncbi:ATP-dependent DNA helicase RecG [Treponema sp.]
MFLRELDASVSQVRGVGPAFQSALATAGITNLATLLGYYPRDWEDRSLIIPLSDFSRVSSVCTEVLVLAHDWFGAGRMKTLKVHVEDESARAVLVCFNRPFLEKQLRIGERFKLWGHFYYKYGEIQSTAFEVEALQDRGSSLETSKSFGQILPIYPLTAALSQGKLRLLMKRALDEYGKRLEEEVPEYLRERDGLLPKSQALRALHFPASLEELEKAKKSIIYEELFYLEVLVGKRALERRGEQKKKPAATKTSFDELQESLLRRLPFTLTEGQKAAVAELNADMAGEYPMARLLQGDVGSGKTLVAFLAALRAIETGGQVAIMAPTELLARQHAETAAQLLEPLGVRPAFLTGNVKASGRKELLKALGAGNIDLVIGTHALFSKDVAYKALRLIVVDEQHRFGVVQRAALMAKGDKPDLLMMSATPIPRTLALTVFGDLDVSVIPDLPPGRKPIKTHLAAQKNEAKVYDFVRKELERGRQAYFVYPLIDADESKGLKDTQSMAERLATAIFPEYPVALVHSKLDEEKKRTTMEEFRKGTVRVLVATSVVEVGVDVPNASCMVIEHAERFGLSALHQLRGRVGRGLDQAYCFLVFSNELTEDGKARLKVMLENTDGFIIAEEDLKLRGPGQIAGIEQSGYLSLGYADPVRDAGVLAQARIDAFAMLEKDPALLETEHRLVAEVLRRAPPFSTATL